MLYRSELKKLLFTHRGIWLLILCLILKLMVLSVFPEQKDSRILLSQKQYDKFLTELHGENTPEKSDRILSEFANCKQLIDMQETMRSRHASDAITDEEWASYTRELDQAHLHKNALTIFSEKAEQFAAQSGTLAPAHYIYEYGWQTVFTLLQFPDIFLLFALLVPAALCFPAETADGMLPVLLAARDGRRKLFRTKLLVLLTICSAAALLFGGLELLVFLRKGWLIDANAPLYSITLLTECTLELTLWQGYLLCLLIRTFTALLFTGVIFALSLWIKKSTDLIFLGLCILLLPLLWNAPVCLFTHSGLSCGTRTLLLLGSTGLSPCVPVGTVTGYSVIILVFAQKRHQRGL